MLPVQPDRPTYRRIMRSAEELFKNHGFRGVTMELVAREAAVSKATLYSYFRDKDSLFLAVCGRMADLLVRAVSEALEIGDSESAASPEARVIAALLAKHRLTFTLVRSSPHAEDLFSYRAQLAGDLFARADDAIVQRLADALAGLPHTQQLARVLFFGSGAVAARSATLDHMESEVASFVTTHLTGARALAAAAPHANTSKGTRA